MLNEMLKYLKAHNSSKHDLLSTFDLQSTLLDYEL